MAGTLLIPWTFGAASGNVPASRLDDDYNAVRDYVNPREVVTGTLAARPAAGVGGRWYFANDVNGGTLFIDTGAAWLAVAQGLTAAGAGSYLLRGLVGANNTATPTTKYDLAADLVQLRDPVGGGIVVRVNTGTLTNDTGLAGPAANGRDQVGAFSTAIWLHFYFIWNGATLATLSSIVAPPTGPTLPSGYTHWAYAGAVRYNAGPVLVTTRMRGAEMMYDAGQAALSGGTATVETAVSVTTLVPPNALDYRIVGSMNPASGATDLDITLTIRAVSGGGALFAPRFGNFSVYGAATGQILPWPPMLIPNVSQQFFYLHTINAGSVNTGSSLQVTSYRVPNGGE